MIDCFILYMASSFMTAALTSAIPAPVVRIVFPGMTFGGYEWGLYVLYWSMWTIVTTWFVVGWVIWKNSLASHIPLLPLRSSRSATAILVITAIAANFAWGLPLNYAFPDALAADVHISADAFRPECIHIMAITTVVTGPVMEEVIYRGVLQTALENTRLRFWGAAVVSSSVFALAHFYSWPGTLDIFGIGIILSTLLRLTGSILPGIVAHGAINLIYIYAYSSS